MHAHGAVSSLLDAVHVLQLSWLHSFGVDACFLGESMCPWFALFCKYVFHSLVIVRITL